jgi:hypothetical protein
MDEDGFLRQRRNLIVISFLLLFTHGTGLTLEEINVLGNKAELAQTFRLEPVLWLSWVYLLLRYWQAFKEYAGPRFGGIFGNEFLGRLEYLFRVKFESPELSEALRDDYDSVAVGKMVQDIKVNGWSAASASVSYIHQGLPGKLRSNIPNPVRRRLNAYDVWSCRIRAFFYIAFNKSVLTELYLPFLIALSPVVFAARTGY